jgi:hypothetical protein
LIHHVGLDTEELERLRIHKYCLLVLTTVPILLSRLREQDFEIFIVVKVFF